MNNEQNQSPSTEERMLRQLGQQLTETVSKILGATCRVELNITGAPVSKVALVSECNKNAAAGAHRILLKQPDTFCITVCDSSYLPF